MKIAFVSQPWNQVIPSLRSSSIVIWTHEVSRRLVQAGECDVVIYAKRGQLQPSSEQDGNIQYRWIHNDWQGMLHRLLDKIAKTLNWQWRSFSSRLYYLPYILRIAHDLRQQQCDLVHIHNLSQFVPIIRLFNPQIKIVLHMHCEWLTQLDSTQISQRIHQVDLVVGCSEFIVNNIRQQFPSAAEYCQTLHNGVDPQQFSRRHRATKCQTLHNGVDPQQFSRRHRATKPDAPNLLYVGRVSPEKGVHILLQAFEQVVAVYPDAQLTVVGALGASSPEFTVGFSDDPIDRSLLPLFSKHYAADLQQCLAPAIADRVTFTGSMTHSNLMELYKDADVFIYPSVWNEPFGIPIVEAMAAEIPVVSTRSGGIVEIIDHGQTGLLVQRNHASELASAMLRLLSDPEKRTSLAIAGRQRVLAQFTWDQIATELLHHYRQLCQPGTETIEPMMVGNR